MNVSHPPLADSNPFSTRFVRPGAIPYVFGPRLTAEQLVEKLHDVCWWGQILGPHGTGKSTLLQTLMPCLQNRGRQLEVFTLHQSQTSLGIDRARIEHWNSNSQIVVDGYEQLSWWNRWRLVRRCRKIGAGLLVTTHQNLGLPTLFETRVPPELAQMLTERLVGQHSSSQLVSASDAADALARHQGNLREAFFALYDLYEKRRSG